MAKEMALSIKGKSVGTVRVDREGLYYRIRCRCKPEGKQMVRLAVSCNEREEILGILVPEGDIFVLDKKIAVKRLGEGELRFRLIGAEEKRKGTYIPVYPEEPFDYVSRLKHAYMERRGDELGVMIEL